MLDLTEDQIADLIRQAVQLGRFQDAPADPSSLVE